MISMKNIKGLSVNRAGEGKDFRKSPSSHNRWPEDEAWRTDQCTAETPSEGARGVQVLKETQQKRRLGGGRHLRGWGIVDACHINGDLELATSGIGRFLYGRGPKWQTRIGFPIFNSDDFCPGPFKCFKSL
jgi:hypothetical protein